MTTRRRALVTRWLLPIAAVGALVAVIALAGGFQAARGDAGPPAQPGEVIELARWEIAVDHVELVNTTLTDSPTSTRLRVHLTVTLTGEESEFTLPSGLVSVVVPDGSATDPGHQVGYDWMSQLDPFVTRTFVMDYTWPQLDEGGEQEAVAAVPETVAVIVRDEIWAEGALFGWSWGVDDVAAVVTVPVADVRVES